MLKISDLFAQYRKSPNLDKALADLPRNAAAHLDFDTTVDVPSLLNICAAFHLWWRSRGRTIWRIRPDTAAHLRGVGMGFLPEEPPVSWDNDVILLESTDLSPMVADVFSMAIYRIPDSAGIPRYFFVGLRQPDGVWAFGVRTDLGAINAKLAHAGRLLDLDSISDIDIGPSPPEMRQAALKMIVFGFAASFFLADPALPGREISFRAGPPQRDSRGVALRRDGRPLPLWSYGDFSWAPQSPGPAMRETLDKTGLALLPVIVRPYFRRLETGRVILVSAHDSARWKRPEKIGRKITR